MNSRSADEHTASVSPRTGEHRAPGIWDDVPWRRVRSVFVPASAVVALAILGTRFTSSPTLLRLLDNVHWTVSDVAAAWCAWIGVRAAGPADRRPRLWLAWGLTAYTVGQCFWDAQVALGWTPFPAPSDVFYLGLGPLAALGLAGVARSRVSRAGVQAVVLDAGALVVAAVAVTLALYLPLRGDHGALEMAVLVAYPVGLFTAAGIATVLAPTLRLRPAAGWMLTIVALFGHGALWMKWNALMLAGRVEDGTLFNAAFSVLALAAGLGASGWSARAVASPRGERRYEVALRVLPLFVVLASCGAVVVAFAVPGVPAVVEQCTGWAAAIVVTLTLLRQSVLLRERDQLLDAEQHFKTLFESAPNAILIMNEERFIDCNPAAERMFGTSRAELCQATPVLFSPALQPDGRPSGPAAREHIAAALLGETQFFAWRHLRADGTAFEAEVGLNRVDLPGGRVLQAVVRDVSERHEAEVVRRRLEEQLHHASRLEAMGRLAGGVAHDFNNVLTVILGTSELALMRARTDEQLQRDLGEVRRSAQRAAALTAQLLAFSRKQVVAPVPSDLNALVSGALVMLRRLIGEDVELAFAPGADADTILVDPTQLEQVLVNLAVNARDAMPAGGKLSITTGTATLAEADCRVHAEARPGRYALLEVCDTGPGIPADVIEHVFEPFYTTKEFGRGTGLGLSTVYGIVKQSGGFIELVSAPGEGARFRLHFPASTVQPRSQVRPPATAPAQGREHVLLVEDDPLVRDLATRVLGGLGYRVRSAGSGPEAIAYAAEEGATVDLLLTDVIMPGLSGRELYEQLRVRRPHLPVIYMSGYTHNVIAPHGVLGPDTHFIQKPFALDALAALVREALDRRPGTAAASGRRAA